MEHEWFLDTTYEPDDDSEIISREICSFCEAYKYNWIKIENGSIKKQYYILDGDTQYGHIHKCSRSLVSETLF